MSFKGCSNCRFHELHDYLKKYYCHNRECFNHLHGDHYEEYDCEYWEKDVFGAASRGSCKTCKYSEDITANDCICTCIDDRRYNLKDSKTKLRANCSFWSPKDVKKSQVFTKLQCIYCGKELTDIETNNADDYGLHPETRSKVCCCDCDQLITIPNRLLKSVVDSNGADKKRHLEKAVSYLLIYLKDLR